MSFAPRKSSRMTSISWKPSKQVVSVKNDTRSVSDNGFRDLCRQMSEGNASALSGRLACVREICT